ncbi:MAG: hypothetical protein H7177_10380 [Rhizobacter sp.]|nr:hypothetical protein [Bacteriovorax sp.]
MKILMTLILVLGTFEATASTFQCRSYETGKIVIADTEARTVKFEDRFGNELDLLDNVDSVVNVLTDGPVVTQTVFTREGVKVFTTEDQDGFIRGFTVSDESFMCFIRK